MHPQANSLNRYGYFVPTASDTQNHHSYYVATDSELLIGPDNIGIDSLISIIPAGYIAIAIKSQNNDFLHLSNLPIHMMGPENLRNYITSKKLEIPILEYSGSKLEGLIAVDWHHLMISQFR